MRPPITFFVAGIPKGQPRSRACVRGKHAGVYDPGTANDWKGLIRLEARRAWEVDGVGTPFTGPTKIDESFFFPRPGNHFGSKKNVPYLKPDAPEWHTGKPDRDNLDKAVLDALKNLGILSDDAIVCDGKPTKRYAAPGATPGCHITIQEAE